MCINLSGTAKKGMYTLKKKTSEVGQVAYITHTFCHTFHQILTIRHSVFTDHSSMKQEHFHACLIRSRALSSEVLDSDCRAKADVGECPEAGHVMSG